ncbi:hypothetical protein QE418_003414 [Microbacterium testaceum]|nr:MULTISPECIES: hypothetical protein [Microbacterium]MDQ1113966.1 hypothetical protein [Microbacterium testaceum]MDR6098928.1 hypothetical protein [Microbacterium sp. SORGH_AS_0454]
MTHHTHVAQGRVEGCPPCDSIRPESQQHPQLVPPLPRPTRGTTDAD